MIIWISIDLSIGKGIEVVATKHNRKKNLYRKMLYRMQKRLGVIFLLFCLLAVALIGRLMYINYVSGARYEKIVLSQQNYSSTVIPFQRGNIVDAKGTVLATSVDVYNVVLDARELTDAAAMADKKKAGRGREMIDETVKALTEHFSEIQEDQVRKQIEENASKRYIVLAKKVSNEKMSAFKKDTSDKKSKVTGVWFEKLYTRQYPYGSLAASVLGFASDGNSGTLGLEKSYNEVLNGTNGRSYGYVNSDNNVENTVEEAKDGNTLVTSIDANIQSIVETSIKSFNDQMIESRGVAQTKAAMGGSTQGSLHTSVVVMNPNTGEILANANYPGFDLNQPRDLSSYYTPDQLSAMSAEDQFKVLNNIWNNFSVSSAYEPGSTAKILTIAAGLETGTVSTSDTYDCPGGMQVGDYYIHCWKHEGHGHQTMQQVLQNSCNVGMMKMVSKIGAENFSKYQARFNLGQKTGIDLPGEASTGSLLYTKEQLASNKVSLATNAFGQNYNVNMMQMVSAFSSVINGGNYYEPHLVTAIKDPQGNTVKTIEPTLMKKTVSKETSDTLKTFLKGAVDQGTGSKAAVAGYSIGGKTGTAEKVPRGTGNYLLSFIGAAPIENPQVVIYVVVDQPDAQDQTSNSYAAQIFSNIASQILPYMNVPTINDQARQEADQAAKQAKEKGVDLSGGKTNTATTDTPNLNPDEGAADRAANTQPGTGYGRTNAIR